MLVSVRNRYNYMEIQFLYTYCLSLRAVSPMLCQLISWEMFKTAVHILIWIVFMRGVVYWTITGTKYDRSWLLFQDSSGYANALVALRTFLLIKIYSVNLVPPVDPFRHEIRKTDSSVGWKNGKNEQSRASVWNFSREK